MNTQPVEKKFDPTTAGRLSIVSCGNGWAVYTDLHRSSPDYMGSCVPEPTYVFNSAAALGIAIANLAAHGTITKPLAPELPTVDVPTRLKPIEEFKIPGEAQCHSSDRSCWYVFVNALGQCQHRFCWMNGHCSSKQVNSEIPLFEFIADFSPIYFCELTTVEARDYVK